MRLKTFNKSMFNKNKDEKMTDRNDKSNKDLDLNEITENSIENKDNNRFTNLSNSVRTITLWVIGILIIFLGSIYAKDTIISSIIFIIAGILVLPIIRKLFKENNTIKNLVYVYIFIAHIVFYANLPTNSSEMPDTQNTASVTLSTVYEASNKGKYTGQVEEGNRTGYGTYKWSTGAKYEGEFKDNLPEGKGKMTFETGEVYVGDFSEGKKNGVGKYTFSNGDIYEGDFSNDLMQGNGKYTFSNGDIYEGQFKNNMFNGNGTYTKDGTPYTGTWENNKLKE